MKISVPADKEKAFSVAMALASDKRLRIISILLERPMTLAEIHKQIGGSNYTSTTFRDLEILVTAGLLEKFYDCGVNYRFKTREVVFRIQPE